MIRQYKLRDYNFKLVVFLIVLTFTGVLLVGSAEPTLQNKQFAGMILGLTLMVIVFDGFQLDFELLLDYVYF